jgi:hypothetical protein
VEWGREVPRGQFKLGPNPPMTHASLGLLQFQTDACHSVLQNALDCEGISAYEES